jgi:hypothetical protein
MRLSLVCTGFGPVHGLLLLAGSRTICSRWRRGRRQSTQQQRVVFCELLCGVSAEISRNYVPAEGFLVDPAFGGGQTQVGQTRNRESAVLVRKHGLDPSAVLA